MATGWYQGGIDSLPPIKIVAVRGECKTTTGLRYGCHAQVLPDLYDDEPALRGYLTYLIRDAAKRDDLEIDPTTLTYEKMTPQNWANDQYRQRYGVEFI